MAGHTAKSLFDLNIQGAEECIRISDGVASLASTLNLDWLLRSAVVLAVSAMDAYFHDKVRYRAGRFPLYREDTFTVDQLPQQLRNLKVPLSDLGRWEMAGRKGNMVRNWATEHLAVRPLQSPYAIAEALKLAGIEDFWSTVEPGDRDLRDLLERLNVLVKRRNQIAHEGDRLQSRTSGKRLRGITREYALEQIRFTKELVARTELRFPD